MGMMRKQLGEILLSMRSITQQQLDDAVAEQLAEPRPLGQILVQLGYISDTLLLQALAAQKGVSAWHLDQDPPELAALSKLSQDVCRRCQVLPVRIQNDLLILAMRDPDNIETIDMARNLSGCRIQPVLADATKLARHIEARTVAPTVKQTANSKAVDAFIQEAMKNVGDQSGLDKKERAVLSEEETRPVVGLVNQIVSEAINQRASDIHIEHQENRIEVRLRIDGELATAREFPAALGPMLTTRIKIMAGIDIVETRIPQDGRVTAEINDRNVDLRVSVLPGYHGPRIVMRVLDRAVGLKSLDDIGFSDSNFGVFRKLVQRPYGLFLVTGPTGSGKTTTLYAALNELRNGRNNVMTSEDPVEYLIDGISQSQVNDRVGLTFASQLRAMLRQDPDVILVGEIRDQETAQTAIRASMTGHMVLSTLHTNDALSVIPRLYDMDVEPLLLSTSLVGVMSQRLLRTLCPHCKREQRPTDDDLVIIESALPDANVGHVFVPAGCEQCDGTGYRGRMAVHELLPVTSEISKMIAKERPIEEIRETATLYGYEPMQVDAARRIIRGDTSVAEARRLLAFDTLAHRPVMPRLAA